jgi:hypothetical protein
MPNFSICILHFPFYFNLPNPQKLQHMAGGYAQFFNLYSWLFFFDSQHICSHSILSRPTRTNSEIWPEAMPNFSICILDVKIQMIFCPAWQDIWFSVTGHKFGPAWQGIWSSVTGHKFGSAWQDIWFSVTGHKFGSVWQDIWSSVTKYLVQRDKISGSAWQGIDLVQRDKISGPVWQHIWFSVTGHKFDSVWQNIWSRVIGYKCSFWILHILVLIEF